jgi:medium-chain acyl-[acyl-carrier-protein] hydrolase
MTTTRDAKGWLTWPKPNPSARVRLFCFPYAGGGASIFRSWPDELPKDIEICAVQSPGRENRFREARYTRLSALVPVLGEALMPFLDVPYAVFGHSLGALAGFELARYLRRNHAPMPSRLLVSSHRAPQLPDRHPQTYHLPDAEFVNELRRLNGIPDAVADEPDLMELMLPLLRADVEMAETYGYTAEPPLLCPISAFGGMLDKDVNEEELSAWREQTQGKFVLHLLPGDHFYFTAHRTMFLQAIIADLR